MRINLCVLICKALAVCLFTSLLPRLSACAEPPRPNILWIWADNLAYRDLSCYGNPTIATPNLDRLAEEGVKFTQYYIGHTVCSPSRAGLLTGRQPAHCGVVDVLRPDSPSGLPLDEITLAELLKTVGYRTAAFGKWHLGDRTEFLPTRQGFDYYLGLPYSMDMLPTLLIENEEVLDHLEGDKVQNVTARLVDSAIDFLGEDKEKPFFIYFNHTLPHPPINLPRETLEDGKTAYQDAVEHIDAQTARLLAALEEKGHRENTLVIFSSDNGPMLRDGDTGILRGRIRDAHEGGIRVPLIARWPGRIPEGRVIEEPAIAYDFFPTFARLAGAEIPSDRRYEGTDIWPLLSGESETIERDHPFVWCYFDRVTAMREGKWKLHLESFDKRLPEPMLYDLVADPSESVSLTSQHPEVVERLSDYAREFEKDLPMVWNLKYPVRDPERRPSGVRRE